MENVKVNIVAITIKEGKNLKDTLRGIRKFHKLKQDNIKGISRSSVCQFENSSERSITQALFVRYCKSLGIRKVTFTFRKGRGTIDSPLNELQYILRDKRLEKGYSQRTVHGASFSIVQLCENGRASITSYVKYAKALGIGELTIIL